MPKKDELILRSFKCPRGLLAEVKAFCKERGWWQQTFFINAVREKLDREKRGRRASP